MKFQGQWMSADISSSFLPKVVCTSEVKTCSRSSCHGTERKAPAALPFPRAQPLYPSTACPLHTPPQPRASTHRSAQVLCKGDVSAASQEEKEYRQAGTPNTAVPKAPLALKSMQGTGGLCSAPFFLPLLKDRPCQGSQFWGRGMHKESRYGDTE